MQQIKFFKKPEHIKVILAYSYLFEELTQTYYEYWDNNEITKIIKPKDTLIEVNTDFKSIIDTLLYFLEDKTRNQFTCSVEQSLILRNLSMQLYYNYTNESVLINPLIRDLISYHEKRFGMDPSKYL